MTESTASAADTAAGTGAGDRRAWLYGAAVVAAAGVAPFAGFAARNSDELTEYAPVVLWSLTTVVVGLAVFALVARFTRLATAQVGLAVAAAITWCFNFSTLFNVHIEPDRRVGQLLAWIGAGVLLCLVAYRFGRFPAVRQLALVYLVLISVISTVSFASYRLSLEDSGSTPAAAATDAEIDDRPLVRQPNVYYFLFDEYGRNDQLQRVLGYDNEPHHEALRERGFTAFDRTFSAYAYTILSLSSIFSTDYVATPENPPEQGLLAFTGVVPGHNAVVDWFRAHGYSYAYAGAQAFNWGGCQHDVTDLCIDSPTTGWSLSEVESSMLDLTPLGSMGLTGQAIGDPVHVMASLDESDLDEPFFVFAHILSPHGPYRYDEDCHLKGELQRPADPKDADDQAAYLQDLECQNQMMLQVADELAETDPGAILIFQSDHGSRFAPVLNEPWEAWTESDLDEFYSTFFAVRAPEECPADDLEGHVTVNTFRWVEACLEGVEPDYLPDRSFVWREREPTDVHELDDPVSHFASGE